jgi:hypothetical protein
MMTMYEAQSSLQNREVRSKYIHDVGWFTPFIVFMDNRPKRITLHARFFITNLGIGKRCNRGPQGPPVNSKPRGNESKDKYN